MNKEEIKKQIGWLQREMLHMFDADKKKARRELASLRKQLKEK